MITYSNYANQPDVSIVVTSYNYGKYICRCLRSCLAQRYIPVEVIVADDSSSDDTTDQLDPFWEHISFIESEYNKGVAETANRGFKKARGQFVVRVDADDFINENLCFFLRTYLVENHDAFCVACDYLLVDEHENVLERRNAKDHPISCGIMYRRDVLLEAGGYNNAMRHREEEELRKRLGDYYKVHHLQLPFYRYRMHDANKTKDPEYKDWELA